MGQTFKIKNFVTADRNDQAGLYHFVITMTDNTQCRLIYSKKPEWRLLDVNRLLTVPCPICRKDYYCSCMARHAEEIEREIADKGYLETALV